MPHTAFPPCPHFMKAPIVFLANTLFSVTWVPFHLCHSVRLLCHDHKKKQSGVTLSQQRKINYFMIRKKLLDRLLF